jgi:MFS family permease
MPPKSAANPQLNSEQEPRVTIPSEVNNKVVPVAKKAFPAVLALVFLGFLGALQGSDPNIASTALLSAGTDLKMGSLTALAASVSTLALAASVISTGMLADRLGRKKVIFAAMVLAVIGDGIVYLAQDPWMFIIGRALAGIALGTIYGAAFAYVKYFGETSKGGIAVALGTFSAAIGLFTLVVTFVGSSLVGEGWRVAFLVIPVMSIIALILAIFILPSDGKREKITAPWDALGQVILGLAIVFSLYGISHAADGLTSPLTIGPFVIGLVLFGLFYLRERKNAEKRFFPVALLKSPLFLAAIGVGFLYNFSTGVGLLSFSNLFQYQLDLKGLSLSLSQLPYLVVAIPVVLIIGKLIGKNIISRQMSAFIGAVISAAGAIMFTITALSSPKSVMDYVPALIVLGAGAAIPAVAYGGMILEEADAKHYGVVSSSRTTIGQFWYSLGLAVSTVLIDVIARQHVLAKLGSSAEQQLNTWSVSGTKPTDASVFPSAVEGFSQGFAVLMIVFAILMIVVAIVVLVLGNKADRLKKLESATPSVEAPSGS